MLRTRKEILIEYGSINKFLKPLHNQNINILESPIEAGKWSTFEILSHILFWDRFIIERLSIIKSNLQLSNANINVDEFNKNAVNYVKSGISYEDLLLEIIVTRTKLVNLLKTFSDVDFQKQFIIQDREDTIQSYMNAMVEHDQHHFNQIFTFIKNCN